MSPRREHLPVLACLALLACGTAFNASSGPDGGDGSMSSGTETGSSGGDSAGVAEAGSETGGNDGGQPDDAHAESSMLEGGTTIDAPAGTFPCSSILTVQCIDKTQYCEVDTTAKSVKCLSVGKCSMSGDMCSCIEGIDPLAAKGFRCSCSGPADMFKLSCGAFP